MSGIQELLSDLRAREIQLLPDGDQLRCRAPRGALTPELRDQLQIHKTELLAFLTRSRAALPAISRAPRDTNPPLSFAQARLWFLDQMGDGEAYNVPEALRLTGRLDLDALTSALAAIVDRHESLRTTVQLVDGEACQRIRAGCPVELPVIDLRPLTAGQKDAEILRLARVEATRPFDLSADLMLRCSLLRVADEEQILLLTLHHIAVDGWSMGVLIRELTTLYTKFIQSLPSPLPPLPIQYADFAFWQRAWMQSEASARQLQYWQTRLSGAPQLLQMPTDHPRAGHQTFQGGTLHFEVPAEVSRQLRQLSQRHDATLFMTLLAGFQILLARYSGQTDIVVGSPIANRNHAELEPLIGFFVNTLALRADLAGNPAFSDLLAQVRETTLAAYDHQDIPFERLVETLQPARSLNYNPLIQVLFALQNNRMGKLELPGLRIDELDLGLQPVRFDLEMHLWETADTLTGKCIYNAALFDAKTIRRMLGHFGVLLAAIAAEPNQRAADLPLLSEAERRQVLIEWNDTAVDYPEQTVHHMVEAQVARTPGATAVTFGESSLTYSELNARANRLARYLVSQGLTAGSLVGICVERSLEMAVGILGILKAGAAYVPLDVSYPPERLRFMVEDAAAPFLLTQATLADRLPISSSRVVCLDRDWPIIEQNSAENPLTECTTDGPAYVLYTSGSTGLPKGVPMPHRALANLLRWQLDSGKVTTPATLQFAPISFDVSFQEIFSTWCAGGVLFFIDEERRRNPEALVEFIAVHRIERLFAPAIALQQIAELAAEGQRSFYLREVITAGEQLQVTPALSRWFERMPACSLVNQYGPTETHVVTAYELQGPAREWPHLPPIGRPIANTQIYILDPRRKPVPIGVSGEIHIGGIQVAHGYLNRPELTAERFIDGTYKTGDLARWLPDGNIEYLGRADHQVKIRGMRVEPGEIEALLTQHPAVSEAVVTVRDAGHDKVLVAYVKPGPGELFDPLRLRVFLMEKLPEHMVPSRFVQLDKMPLTPSGKVDRMALPAPGGDSLVTASQYVAPVTPIENQIAAIWSELLGVAQVSVHDNFFDLGGHSLLTVKMRGELQRVLRRDVATVDLFRYPTISALAAHLAQPREAGSATVTQAESRAQKQRNALRQRRQVHADQTRPVAS